ncbi:MAG TPA: hypothetical protein VJX16_27870 [Terriglobales bacterium]|nr:hypothetical protein [Terriglobales bacterium]
MADLVSGLRAGADDYVTRPFDPQQFRARVKVGERVLDLQAAPAAQFAALEDSLAREAAAGACSQSAQAVNGFALTGNAGSR